MRAGIIGAWFLAHTGIDPKDMEICQDEVEMRPLRLRRTAEVCVSKV
jgi:hypothetical protein